MKASVIAAIVAYAAMAFASPLAEPEPFAEPEPELMERQLPTFVSNKAFSRESSVLGGAGDVLMRLIAML